MALFQPATKLEAVNRILKSIGQAPVNTLQVSGISDVARAVQDLDETARDVQMHGWHWNTDRDYPLSPDTADNILIPNGALSVDPEDRTVEASIRALPSSGSLALYNIADRTFEWDDAVDCKIIWGFPFEELPQDARTYIAAAAARRFQARVVSSPILDRFNAEDEERAWALLIRRERAQRDTNLFSASPSLRRMFGRRRF
jgi:hypothetical protein